MGLPTALNEGKKNIVEVMGHIHSIQETSAKARNLNLTQTLFTQKVHNTSAFTAGNKAPITLHPEDDDTVYMPRWMFE